MSVFDMIPDRLPLNPDLAERPVEYTLRADPAERYATYALSAFWLSLTFGVAYSYGSSFLTEFLPALGARLAGAISGTACVLLLLVAWFWRAINDRYRTVSITFRESEISVRVSELGRTLEWSEPIGNFRGVALRNLGTHDIGNRKIPVGSVVLVHPDETRTIPLMIAEATQIGPNSARRLAKTLGIPIVEDVSSIKVEPCMLIVNRFQALKVRLLLWGLAGLTVVFAALGVTQLAAGTPNAVWLILAGVFGLATIAMQVYASTYVVRMHDRGDHLEVQTAALLLSRHRITYSRLQPLEHSEGRSLASRGVAVHAPWIKLRVEGRRLPFVVDMQSEYVDREMLRHALERERQ